MCNRCIRRYRPILVVQRGIAKETLGISRVAPVPSNVCMLYAVVCPVRPCARPRRKAARTSPMITLLRRPTARPNPSRAFFAPRLPRASFLPVVLSFARSLSAFIIHCCSFLLSKQLLIKPSNQVSYEYPPTSSSPHETAYCRHSISFIICTHARRSEFCASASNKAE